MANYFAKIYNKICKKKKTDRAKKILHERNNNAYYTSRVALKEHCDQIEREIEELKQSVSGEIKKNHLNPIIIFELPIKYDSYARGVVLRQLIHEFKESARIYQIANKDRNGDWYNIEEMTAELRNYPIRNETSVQNPVEKFVIDFDGHLVGKKKIKIGEFMILCR